jgi:hypothetical protein
MKLFLVVLYLATIFNISGKTNQFLRLIPSERFIGQNLSSLGRMELQKSISGLHVSNFKYIL